MISVIIPALNEADRLPRLLAALKLESPAPEIIVVDGGSTDETIAVARANGVLVVRSGGGRGKQICDAIFHAGGDILLFLHADSDYPAGGLAQIERTLTADANAVGGNFRLLFDGDDGFSRWLDGFYAWIRAHGFYYGDSAPFVRRAAYDAIGGMRPLALMEDYDFNRRMERLGRTCCLDEPPLRTSSRRFAGRHPVAIVAGWLTIHALFHLGISDRWLAAMYDSARRREYRGDADGLTLAGR